MKKFLIALSLLLISWTLANASYTPAREVTTIAASEGWFIFTRDDTGTDAPACGAGFPNRYAVDPDTPSGQAMISTVITAYSMGKRVSVTGKDVCDVTGNTETALYLNVF